MPFQSSKGDKSFREQSADDRGPRVRLCKSRQEKREQNWLIPDRLYKWTLLQKLAFHTASTMS